MIAKIALKEFKDMIRDGRFRWAAGILFTLLVVSLIVGWKHYREVDREHRIAQAGQREMWLNQGEKNPHSAAHYGVFAFKPKLALSAIDKGLDPYLGVSQFLEAHRQNTAQYRPVEEATPLQRFGELTAGATLQVLIPLLIVLLSYSAFAGEREQRTLRQLLSLGISRQDLAFGKALGVGGPLLLLLVPAAAIGVAAMALSVGADSIKMSLPRMLVMMAGYVVYFAVFIGLGLIVSALAPSSRFALIALLGFWFINSLVASRIVSDIAKTAHPAPSAIEFQKAIDEDNKSLPDWDERVESVKKRLLAEYKVETVSALPVNPEGIALDEGEQDDTRVYEKHYNRLNDIYQNQNYVYQAGAIVAPLLAIQSLSMGMAGTDFAQHRHFSEAAEQYRRQLVGTLNQNILSKGNTDQTWDYKAGRELWESVPPFNYEAPAVGWVTRNNFLSIGLLAAWFIVVVIMTPLVVSKVRID